MKKSLFHTGRKRSKKQKAVDQVDGAAVSWSTDPQDLPPGYSVGSSTVPYTPPESPTNRHEPLALKKNKGKKFKNGHQQSPLAKSHKQLALCREISAPLQPMEFKKRPNFRRNRSCSVDDLDKLDDELSGGGGVSKNDASVEEKVHRRSTSSGVDEGTSVLPAHPAEGSRRMALVQAHRQVSRHHSHQTETYSHSHQAATYSRHQSHPAETYEHRGDSYSTQRMLHEPKSIENFLKAIQSGSVDVNKIEPDTGNAPIHSIVARTKKDHTEFLFTLLINSSIKVDLENSKKKTALLLALENGCEQCARILIVFGANVNKHDANQFTAVDLAVNHGKMPKTESILRELGAKGSVDQMAQCKTKVPRMFSFAQRLHIPKKEERLCTNDNINEFVKRKGTNALYRELEINVSRRMSMSSTIGGHDDAYSLVLQQREIALYNKTLKKPKQIVTEHGIRGGSRLLFLDGGGLKGLVQLEVLMELEERTQCSISDLFDWIVGTSTGGIIALAIVYAKKSLLSLRQLYFLLKDRIFMKNRLGFGYNTETLEEILKDYLDPSMKMSDVSHPKVLIAAVNKATTNLEVHFFNNCFGDEFTGYPVWKVARYTSAAPMMFSEFENYVDGGVICNNPTDCGLTAIQNFCRLQGYKLPIAMAVSIGTGNFPAVKMGSVDAQDALYFGKKWLHPSKLIKQTQNLFSLLSNALVESELVAENSKSRCAEQDIPFFRFSPTFDEIVSSGETDVDKLINMVIQTKIYLKQQDKELEKITNIFHKVAESSQDIQDDDQQASDLAQDHQREGVALSNQNSHHPPILSEVIEEEPEEDAPVEAAEYESEDFEDIVSSKKENIEKGCDQYMKFGLFRSGSLINCIEMDLGKPLESPNKLDFQSPVTSGDDIVPESPSPRSPVPLKQTPEEHNSADTEVQALYRSYRADTRKVDTSNKEYTEYNRETLV